MELTLTSVLWCIFPSEDVTWFSKTPHREKCVVEACIDMDWIERKAALLSDQRSPFPI
jgi:hypothetical protein